jgi:hypothetical protein
LSDDSQVLTLFDRAQELDSLLHDDQSILDSPPQFSFPPEHVDVSVDHSSPSPPDATYRTELDNNISEEPDPEQVLTPIFENRKKKIKSTSTLAPQVGPVPSERQTSPPIDTAKHAPLASTKRKFIPEDDDRFTSNLDEDEFQFRRPNHSPKKQTTPFEIIRQEQSPIKNVQVTRGSKPPALTKRKVLEPSMFPYFVHLFACLILVVFRLMTVSENSNSNLGSPKKARVSSKQDSKLLQQPTKGDENAISPQKNQSSEKLGGKAVHQKPRESKLAPPQKEKCASRPAPAQPAEPIQSLPALSPYPNASKAEEDAGSRPSRRRGAVVSYAEPNLRDKMRRPTKEMIDAVAFGSRRSSSFQPSLDRDDSTQPGSLPADFALANHASQEQVLEMVSRRKRKVSSAPKEESEAENLSTDLKKGIEDSLADISAQVSHDTVGSRRQTRRHSSNPKSTANMAQYDLDQGEPQSPNADSLEDEDLFGPGPADTRRGQRIAARRKSMMV